MVKNENVEIDAQMANSKVSLRNICMQTVGKHIKPKRELDLKHPVGCHRIVGRGEKCKAHWLL
jgi:hypothetical protein